MNSLLTWGKNADLSFDVGIRSSYDLRPFRGSGQSDEMRPHHFDIVCAITFSSLNKNYH